MGDLLQDGLNWLETLRREHLTRTVLYRRGADSVQLAATVAATRFEVDDGYGLVVEEEMRDYILAAEELVLGGARILPKRGDEIVERRDGTDYVYEVMDLGAEKHYRPTDPDGKGLRIHTRLTGTEDA